MTKMNFSEYDDDETEFILTMEKYIKSTNRKFPKFSEILAVLKSLGYRKTLSPTNLPTYRDIVNHKLP